MKYLICVVFIFFHSLILAKPFTIQCDGKMYLGQILYHGKLWDCYFVNFKFINNNNFNQNLITLTYYWSSNLISTTEFQIPIDRSGANHLNTVVIPGNKIINVPEILMIAVNSKNSAMSNIEFDYVLMPDQKYSLQTYCDDLDYYVKSKKNLIHFIVNWRKK